MRRASIPSRFFAVLLSFAMLFGASPSFANALCCDPTAPAMHASDMSHMDMGAAKNMHAQKNMPCKKPSPSCAYLCASMATVGLTYPQITPSAPSVGGRSIWNFHTFAGGISLRPALPPPILSA